jgi:probable rRNA maturation factor
MLRHFKAKKIRNRKWLESKKELTVVFLSAREMQKINKQFRGKNKPTDVLSFAAVDPSSLGELLFCSEVLKRQAKVQNHSEFAETCYMLIHGFLHLVGYDHELSAAEEKLMFRLQDNCFAELKLK